MNRGFEVRSRLSRPGAEDPHDLAAEALAYIAADPETLGRFLAATGVTPESLRAAASGAGFARGILSYVLADEDLLVRFAQSLGRDAAALARVMQAAVGPQGAGA